MVAPHPELQRKLNNTDNIVNANKSQYVPILSTKYPEDYIDLDTHSSLVDIQPWVEDTTIAQASLDIKSCWGPFFSTIDNVLVLCVDFSDRVAQTTIPTINNRFFSITGNTFLNYYKEVSQSRWIPSGEVHGWYRAPHPYTYYINSDYGRGSYPNNITRLVEDTIDLAIAEGLINWASFDTNSNGKIDNLIIVHADAEAAYNTGNINLFWAQTSSIVVQKSAGGKTMSKYSLSAEYMYSGAAQRSGVDCHEFGHILGLPDLYDTAYPTNSNGTGNYSLMSVGCWGNNGLTPVHLDAWSKYKLGFTDVTTDPQGVVTINNVESNTSTIKYTTADPNEYLLIENRQQTLFDSYLPSNGMFIWHINENQSNNNNEACFLVGLVQADGLKDLENKYNNGDAGDPYPGSTNNRIFGVYTTPNSVLCNSTTRNISITNISNSSNTMTFNAVAPAIPVLQGQCRMFDVVTPANVTATNMIVTKSENPCLSGTCTITVDVTWQNTGGASGTFAPSIIVNEGIPIALSSVTLSPVNNAGDTIIRTFTLSNRPTGTYSICPSPN